MGSGHQPGKPMRSYPKIASKSKPSSSGFSAALASTSLVCNSSRRVLSSESESTNFLVIRSPLRKASSARFTAWVSRGPLSKINDIGVIIKQNLDKMFYRIGAAMMQTESKLEAYRGNGNGPG